MGERGNGEGHVERHLLVAHRLIGGLEIALREEEIQRRRAYFANKKIVEDHGLQVRLITRDGTHHIHHIHIQGKSNANALVTRGTHTHIRTPHRHAR